MADKTETGIEIYKGARGEVVFDVDAEGETIWATQAQIAQVFGVDRTVIGRHIRNILKDGELEEKRVCAKNAHTGPDSKVYQVQMYNLDMIISVGYRVNSRKATDFRIWATRTLKQYLTSGLAVNERRLSQLDTKRLHEVEEMMGVVRRLTARYELDAGEANGVLEVISKYAGSFQALKEYDDGHIDLRGLNSQKRKQKDLTPAMCEVMIENLRESLDAGELFGKKRGGGFEGSLASIYQSFSGKELYPSVPEKAANLLYFVIKDHPFYDGNKRIGSLLFVVFLTMNDCHLTASGETKISDRALTAIALLVAESKPSEKELIVSLICKLLEG
ncbi:type II toxin-antitoxin system death-on-curing family toxin [Candidatus Saccharibacteria bacterium]|nr:type II toxin-antitoxin system death-on-curing family toxin [Candidatus Saccharibacteria bacterium]